MMSQTTASALDDRIVTFVSINDEYDCVICMQVADDPVRHSFSCRSVFCGICMEQALNYDDCCPFCREEDIDVSTDLVIRNLIMAHEVFCINMSPDQYAKYANTDTRKRKADLDDDKCNWIGTYDELAAHLKLCEYEIVECTNNGCADKVERCELADHLQVCPHRTEECDHCADIVKSVSMPDHLLECPKVVVSCECGFECARDALTAHRDKNCPLVEICCDVIGCNANMRRGDYGKHQEQALSHHVCLLSAALSKSLERIGVVEEETVRLANTLSSINVGNGGIVADIENINVNNRKLGTELRNVKANNVKSTASVIQLSKEITKINPTQVKWRMTDIAAKLLEAAVDEKSYYSPRFDVFFHGSHKLYIQAHVQGNKLGLFILKDAIISSDKSRLDIGGTSIIVKKAGLPDVKGTYSLESFLRPPHWNRGWTSLLDDMTPYIDNDCINITIDLKLNEVNEPLVL